MPADMLPYELSWKGHLANLSGERRSLAVALIDQFIRWASRDDILAWSSKDTRARRGLVIHPRDTNLRIDFQSTFPDRTQPARRWASFYLEDGAAPKSYAHLELECGMPYAADDVRAAWLASLNNSLSATVIWSPGEFPQRVLEVLSDEAPRCLDEILRVMTATNPVSKEELPSFVSRLERMLQIFRDGEFVTVKLDEDRPALGNCYVRTQKAVEWFR
jgi:hypothetical protein